MVGRVATCIRCQKSFKLDMDVYHGHAHLLKKVGVILRMSKTISCSMKSVRLPEGSLWEHVVFFTSLKWPQFFHGLVWPIQDTMPSCLDFQQVLHFLEFFRWKKTDKWSGMSQVACGVRNHSNLSLVPTMGNAHLPAKVGVISKISKTRPCSMKGVRLLEGFINLEKKNLYSSWEIIHLE